MIKLEEDLITKAVCKKNPAMSVHKKTNVHIYDSKKARVFDFIFFEWNRSYANSSDARHISKNIFHCSILRNNFCYHSMNHNFLAMNCAPFLHLLNDGFVSIYGLLKFFWWHFIYAIIVSKRVFVFSRHLLKFSKKCIFQIRPSNLFLNCLQIWSGATKKRIRSRSAAPKARRFVESIPIEFR